MTDFLQHIVQGLSLGSAYALIALGYTMVYGILQFINFAHSDVFMLGAFFSMYLSRFLGVGSGAQGASLPVLLLILLGAMAACALVGLLIERIAYRPLRNSPRLTVLITAIGVSLFLENVCQLPVVFGASPQSFPTLVVEKPVFQSGNLVVTNIQLGGFLLALSLMAVLQRIVFHTRAGMAMRAISMNREVASLMGIHTDRIIAFTFILGSALAGAAGLIIGQTYGSIRPDMGILWGLKAFVAAVIGGIGSIPGAMAGGLLLGLSEEMVAGYLTSSMRDAIAFGLLILILLFRPAGLFGSARVEKV